MQGREHSNDFPSPFLSPALLWLFLWFCHRMTFKMYAVDFCELLLFDEHKQAYHMVQYAFDKKSALRAFIRCGGGLATHM